MPTSRLPADTLSFQASDLFDALNAASPEQLDELGFGVVRMNAALEVLAYNRAEAALSGLDPAWVLGRRFFSEVAPCTNNHLVADKYRRAGDLDDRLEYVLSFHMRPIRVELRLLRREAHAWSYFCVRKL
jgi:photoactive yellow protein